MAGPLHTPQRTAPPHQPEAGRQWKCVAAAVATATAPPPAPHCGALRCLAIGMFPNEASLQVVTAVHAVADGCSGPSQPGSHSQPPNVFGPGTQQCGGRPHHCTPLLLTLICCFACQQRADDHTQDSRPPFSQYFMHLGKRFGNEDQGLVTWQVGVPSALRRAVSLRYLRISFKVTPLHTRTCRTALPILFCRLVCQQEQSAFANCAKGTARSTFGISARRLKPLSIATFMRVPH